MTPLTEFAQNAAVGRRTAVAAAGGALLVSTFGGAMAAQAAPVETGHAKMNSVDLNALTTQAREALSNAPVVSVAPDAELTVEKTAVSVVSAAENEDYQAELAAAEAEKAAEAAAAEAAEAAEAAAATVSTATSVDVPASAIGNSVISIASRYVGVPYVSGGASPSGMDCSGFTQYVYGQLGIDLPHSSSAQPGYGTQVPASEAQPGDLMWTPGHVSIYAGGNTMIDASKPGTVVDFRTIWQSNPTFIRMG
ncbi:C40 family peptidase [Promicromonospora iranensis]|uniref:Cell wall-associated NlpC family hydrolase n=1 Tax=Promicromonospora iranensis TaxID=1105144 RepID=A0ABU2CR59_9MICO|nr:C40 family peptidase [Promicromonospora iranensis]MDR7383833.1 cell wall-associated NlpC family hydrolase [Promicromonospora iranensis]